MNKKIEATKRYNETAKLYDKRYGDIQIRKYQEVIPEITISDTDLIIDVGGGTGLLSDYLQNNSKNIFICDLSFEMLKEGKRKNKEGHFICADSEALPFRNDCCELVCYFSVFQNLESPDLSLSEGYRSLKPKGRIIVTVLSKLFTQEILEEMLNKNEFVIEKSCKLAVEDFAFIGKKK